MDYTKGKWEAKLYKPTNSWGVRQTPNTPSVSLDGESLPCGFSICNIVAQGKEGEATAKFIASAPETAKQRDALLAALKKYGRHKDDCNLLALIPITKRNGKMVGCTCGWKIATAAIEAAGEK